MEQNSEGISLQVTEIFNKTAQLFMWQCDSTEKVWDSTTFDIDLSASRTQTNSRLATTTYDPARSSLNSKWDYFLKDHE